MVTNVDFDALIQERRAVKQFDPNFSMSIKEITGLLRLASQAPSANNLQHWRFLVIHDAAVKEKLIPITSGNNQQQVKDAAATIAVLGDLEAYKDADAVFNEPLKQGFITEEIKKSLVENIEKKYKLFPQTARDEAFQNASLAAMLFMVAAIVKGYDTCPMGGFDSERFTEVFHIPERYAPIMLIAVGKATQLPAYPRFRFSVEKRIAFNSF